MVIALSPILAIPAFLALSIKLKTLDLIDFFGITLPESVKS